jgi:hypothetical protein
LRLGLTNFALVGFEPSAFISWVAVFKGMHHHARLFGVFFIITYTIRMMRSSRNNHRRAGMMVHACNLKYLDGWGRKTVWDQPGRPHPFFFLAVLGFELKASHLLGRLPHRLSHSASSFFVFWRTNHRSDPVFFLSAFYFSVIKCCIVGKYLGFFVCIFNLGDLAVWLRKMVTFSSLC